MFKKTNNKKAFFSFQRVQKKKTKKLLPTKISQDKPDVLGVILSQFGPLKDRQTVIPRALCPSSQPCLSLDLQW